MSSFLFIVISRSRVCFYPITLPFFFFAFVKFGFSCPLRCFTEEYGIWDRWERGVLFRLGKGAVWSSRNRKIYVFFTRYIRSAPRGCASVRRVTLRRAGFSRHPLTQRSRTTGSVSDAKLGAPRPTSPDPCRRPCQRELGKGGGGVGMDPGVMCRGEAGVVGGR